MPECTALERSERRFTSAEDNMTKKHIPMAGCVNPGIAELEFYQESEREHQGWWHDCGGTCCSCLVEVER